MNGGRVPGFYLDPDSPAPAAIGYRFYRSAEEIGAA